MKKKVEKILFLNLPHNSRVQRRYMCSYNTPNMLFPPIELLYLASIAREWHKLEVSLLDAIAENLHVKNVETTIETFEADIIVSLTGFEIFEEDIKVIRELKQKFPNKIFIIFGHYPTTFPEETLKHSTADYILHGEPDINFSNLINYLTGVIQIENTEGIYYKDAEGEVIYNEGKGRIRDTKNLPLPAHDLLKISLYKEPFLPKPLGLIQSARGCPYSCNFCVRSFGIKLSLRSPESIVEEIKLLVKLHQIKSLRFIDDTFTATSKRVIKFCQLLIDSGITLDWSCLSRADTLDEEMISWMKKSGCVRVYIGVESGSPKILELIDKKIDLDQGLVNINLLHKYGIETTAFFMVGYPEETEKDFQLSVDYALKGKFDYVIPGQFIPYPGTIFFEKYKENIDFKLFPYTNTFKNKELAKIGLDREKEFYRNYYFRFGYLGMIVKKFLAYPRETLLNSIKFIKYQFNKKNRNTLRKDYI